MNRCIDLTEDGDHPGVEGNEAWVSTSLFPSIDKGLGGSVRATVSWPF